MYFCFQIRAPETPSFTIGDPSEHTFESTLPEILKTLGPRTAGDGADDEESLTGTVNSAECASVRSADVEEPGCAECEVKCASKHEADDSAEGNETGISRPHSTVMEEHRMNNVSSRERKRIA